MVRCFRKGLYWQGLTHDITKLTPRYFHIYAIWDNHPHIGINSIESEAKDKWRKKYRRLSDHHHNTSRHHWHKYSEGEMPVKYIEEMLSDWESVSEIKQTSLLEWYLEHYADITLGPASRRYVDYRLGLISKYAYDKEK